MTMRKFGRQAGGGFPLNGHLGQAPESASESQSLTVTRCQLKSSVTHSKQTTATHSNRHRNEGGSRRPFRGVFLVSILTFLFSVLGATAFSQSPQKPVVATDLAAQLAKFKPVKMPFDSSHLTAREKQMVAKLVDAAGLLDCVYWRQSDPEGLKLYLSLANRRNPH